MLSLSRTAKDSDIEYIFKVDSHYEIKLRASMEVSIDPPTSKVHIS